MRAVFHRVVDDLTVENLIKQVAYYTVWLLGLLLAASTFGIEPEAIVTGLGLSSLALGFALKDILSNFVSGLLILLLRPFELGDQIVAGVGRMGKPGDGQALRPSQCRTVWPRTRIAYALCGSWMAAPTTRLRHKRKSKRAHISVSPCVGWRARSDSNARPLGS